MVVASNELVGASTHSRGVVCPPMLSAGDAVAHAMSQFSTRMGLCDKGCCHDDSR